MSGHRLNFLCVAVAFFLPLATASCSATPDLPYGSCLKLVTDHQSLATLNIIHADVEQVKHDLFVSSDLENQWHKSNSILKQGWVGWSLLFKVIHESDGKPTLIQNPIIVDHERPLRALFLLRNGYKLPHPVRIVILLDYQQVQIRQDKTEKPYLELDAMQPGEDIGFEVEIPTLPKGFHQISLFPIADFDSLSTDIYYRGEQQNSIHEYRYDLWNGIAPFNDTVPKFIDAKAGLFSSVLFTSVELIHTPEQIQNQPLLQFEAESNSEVCLRLRFMNVRPITDGRYRDPVSIKLAIFWDDQLSQTLDYTLQPDIAANFTLPLSVKVPSAPGRHLLQITPIVLPGYSQFNSINERTTRSISAFSKRVVVTVKTSSTP